MSAIACHLHCRIVTGLTFLLSHIRSLSKLGLTATVVVVQRWSGSKVTLMLSLMGNIRLSSLLPQYLITAMFVGVWAVVIKIHLLDWSAIASLIRMLSRSRKLYSDKNQCYQFQRIKYEGDWGDGLQYGVFCFFLKWIFWTSFSGGQISLVHVGEDTKPKLFRRLIRRIRRRRLCW